MRALNLSSPHKRTKSRDSQPWISPDLKRKIRRRDKAFKASKKHGRIRDERKFQQLKKEVQRDLRRSYWQYVDDIVTSQDTDHNEYSGMKRFWTFIKHQRSDFSNIAPLKVNGRLITDPKMKAETLNHQFQSVFTRETDFQPMSPEICHPYSSAYQHHGTWCGETAEKFEAWKSIWS